MAPLTLLVGENSTGKTSFLAILCALWEVAVNEVIPDFRREPYDLGAFSEIVYNDSSRGEQPDSFQAGFRDSTGEVSFRFMFKDIDGVIAPVSRCVLADGMSFEIALRTDDRVSLQVNIEERSLEEITLSVGSGFKREWIVPFDNAMGRALDSIGQNRSSASSVREAVVPYAGSALDERDVQRVVELRKCLQTWQFRNRGSFASAPIRSKPRRTYDPSRPITDPEGEYIPSYLSMMSRREPNTWSKLKERLEKFGSESGLFDEVSIESFGRTDDAAPFQIQIRKFGGKLKGNRRNLIDVGYGVSQTLPIITELLRPDAPPMFLLQQPEVHLHPSAQAALGSLFCSIAGPDRHLVVETHSDYIVNRVRMDVRDGKTDLKPEDISVLYFERGESDVKIHSIRMDDLGNVLDAPDSYGAFFMEETRRSIGI